jgi:hypothetical protein
MNPLRLVDYSSSDDETTINRIPFSPSSERPLSEQRNVENEPSTDDVRWPDEILHSWSEWWAQPMPELEIEATILTAPPLQGGFDSEEAARLYCS